LEDQVRCQNFGVQKLLQYFRLIFGNAGRDQLANSVGADDHQSIDNHFSSGWNLVWLHISVQTTTAASVRATTTAATSQVEARRRGGVMPAVLIMPDDGSLKTIGLIRFFIPCGPGPSVLMLLGLGRDSSRKRQVQCGSNILPNFRMLRGG